MNRANTRRASAERRAAYPKPTSRWERRAREQGLRHVAGVDEVGRGCLFGPVVAAAVILDPEKQIRGLDDSKRLDPATREVLSRRIRERSVAVAVAAADSGRIDRLNIYQAARRAMRDAVLALPVAADYVLVDAMTLDLEVGQQSLIRGDRRSRSIAAASIVAKVERDGWMRAWDEVFPEYGLASNKGYASPAHLRALKRFGPTPLHRMSFRPVAERSRFSPELDKRAPETLPLFPDLDPEGLLNVQT